MGREGRGDRERGGVGVREGWEGVCYLLFILASGTVLGVLDRGGVGVREG